MERVSTSKAQALILGILALVASAGAANACTTFCLRDGERVVFGKNYDWGVAAGHLLVNPRGLVREAFGKDPHRAHWTARFGNVTFNQYGQDFPSGGINEAGLVIELMWLDGSKYPAPDQRARIGNLQWIQYLLDTAATVREVIASDADIRITARAPLHYLVADLSGQVATIEFLDGEMVVHTGDELPFPALTNSRYDRSRDFLRHRRGARLPPGRDSLPRFARAASHALAFSEDGASDPVNYAFGILEDVAQGARTQWSIVYEMHPASGEKRVHWKTRDVPLVKYLDLGDLDFSCSAGARSVDLHLEVEGDLVSHLRPATEASNHRLVNASYRQTDSLAGMLQSELDSIASYPDSARCKR